MVALRLAEYPSVVRRPPGASVASASPKTSPPVDHNVCAVAARNAAHAIAQLLDGGINDLVKSEHLRLPGFRRTGRVDIACLAPWARASCVTALPTDPPIAGASTVLPA